MSDTQDLIDALEEAKISKTNAARYAKLNPRTVAKIFDGEEVTKTTRDKILAGIKAYKRRDRDDLEPDTSAVDILFDPQDIDAAIALVRKCGDAMTAFVRKCQDGHCELSEGDASKFSLPINVMMASMNELQDIQKRQAAARNPG